MGSAAKGRTEAWPIARNHTRLTDRLDLSPGERLGGADEEPKLKVIEAMSCGFEEHTRVAELQATHRYSGSEALSHATRSTGGRLDKADEAFKATRF